MQIRHVPTINARYWAGIALASVFGTNMGDLYAHDSGLGLLGGLPILILLFLVIYGVERFDKRTHDAWYWLCIVIMRTGATNIADYMAGRQGMHIDRITLSIGFGLLLALLAWWLGRIDRRSGNTAAKTVPTTDPGYWVTMLTAGVFGTVAGDLFEHRFSEDIAAIGLAVVLAVTLFSYRRYMFGTLAGYWLTVGVARTTGTAIGDWLAESPIVNLGLPLSTAITGATLAAVLLLWPGRSPEAVAAETPA
ncbi:MAG TPA: hypothetical protein VHC39_15775 [Rhizomicrobium sp.]|nr:hypothetical protein [Rhizomicrobium sp.]